MRSQERDYEVEKCMELTHSRVQWRALVLAVLYHINVNSYISIFYDEELYYSV
jgi:hypothetical protein